MALASLRKEFGVAVGAAEQAIRVNTDELDDAISTIGEVCKQHGWELRVWDHVSGTIWHNGEPPKKDVPGGALTKKQALMADLNSPEGPTTPLQELLGFLAETPRPDTEDKGEVVPVVLVMKNFHLLFERDRGPAVAAVQHLVADKVGDHALYNKQDSNKQPSYMRQLMDQFGIEPESDTGKFIVGLMPAQAQLPPEVSPLFKVIEHELPDEEELGVILDGIVPSGEAAQDEDGPAISKSVRKRVCKHARGLTRLQAEGVFSACMVQNGKKQNFEEILPKYVWEHKSRILNREGLVTLYGGKETFDDVVGLHGAKEIFKDLLAPDKYDPDNPDLRSKGAALVGPPRTGKSLIAKACNGTLDLPVLMCDPGSLMGGFVGDTERNTRKFFQIVRAHAPCIAVIDEVEKVMPSARGGEHDSGVGKRMAGQFMTQMQDIQEPVFWVFTANGVEDLHEAFLADDRVDTVIYVHMPGPAQRAAGWKMYIQKFFPAEVRGKAFPHHLTTEFDEVLGEFKKTKKVNALEWANKFIAALLCLHGAEREAALARLAKQDDNVFTTVSNQLVDDADWTLARIKAVCRLARKRNRSLAQIAKMMPRYSAKLEKSIRRLENWAEDEAVDSETGEAYVRPEDQPDAPAGSGGKVKTTRSGKVKRKVRRVAD